MFMIVGIAVLGISAAGKSSQASYTVTTTVYEPEDYTASTGDYLYVIVKDKTTKGLVAEAFVPDAFMGKPMVSVSVDFTGPAKSNYNVEYEIINCRGKGFARSDKYSADAVPKPVILESVNFPVPVCAGG
jgi:hypothetical protein